MSDPYGGASCFLENGRRKPDLVLITDIPRDLTHRKQLEMD